MALNLKRFSLSPSQIEKVRNLSEDIKIDKHLIWWYSEEAIKPKLKEIDSQLKELREKRAEIVKRQKDSAEKTPLHSKSLEKNQEQLSKILDSGSLVSKLIRATVKAKETERMLEMEMSK